MVENLPATVVDESLIPGPVTKIPRAHKSARATATEARAIALQQRPSAAKNIKNRKGPCPQGLGSFGPA